MKDNINKDQKYLNIVSDILEHDEFSKTKDIVHHGMNRYDHSLRVSYYSYKIAKVLKLDEEEVARGALLHDFFLDNNRDVNLRERVSLLINHPKYALDKASQHFDLTEKQKDMIVSHMWPVSIRAPRYLESWIVDLTDNYVAIAEAMYNARSQLSVASNFLIVLLLNYLR